MYQNQEYKNRFRILKGGIISLVVASNLYGAPSGGNVTSGTATIKQNGNITNINQSSQKASINWKDFSISKNETVNFNQPNKNSITLNRVLGNEKSVIDGALNANGQVWILNSNGVLFDKNAKVNTSGILATTKELSDENFQKGNYNFKGDSKATIENLGNIDSKKYASFIANSVVNNGTIKVYRGTINLIGASEFLVKLDENSNISLKITKGVLDALVENNNLLIANAGEIYLTTNAKDELLKGVVNSKGIIEANSIDGLTGKVELFAHGGTTNVSGTIEAKDGFVETSGDKVKIANTFKVTANKWLIDPTDFTIASSDGDMTGKTLSNNLNGGTNVEIQSTNGKVNINGNGDIFVKDTISWNSDKTLTLNAQNDIFINKSITATNNDGKLALKYGQLSTDGGSSNYYVNAKVNLKAGQNFSTQKGTNVSNLKNYTVITSLGSATSSNDGTLQGINGNRNGNYVLGSDIDASVTKTDTANWGTEGFNPIGNHLDFTGSFDGLGHIIDGLTINRESTDFVGLFGYARNSTIKNIGLTNVDIRGKDYVGGLVGRNTSFNNGTSTVSNSYTTGSVSGKGNNVGGLVGENASSNNGTSKIENSYAIGSVSGKGNNVGGLVGQNTSSNNGTSTVSNSYTTGSVSGTSNLGGLVGNNYSYNATSTISNSYATGSVIGTGNNVGGLVGYNNSDMGTSTISNSYALGSVSGNNYVGGLVGQNYSLFGTSTISNSYWDIDTTGKSSGVGSEDSSGVTGIHSLTDTIDAFNQSTYAGFDFTNTWYMIEGETRPFLRMEYSTNITNDHQLQLMAMDLNANYTLAKDITYTGDMWSSKGFNPIGNNSNRFTGTFDGLGHSIDGLTINRESAFYVGLFGATQNSTIKNIGLTNVDIRGNNQVGGLVGVNYSIDNGTSKIENSYVTGSVNGTSNVGGLVGVNNSYNGTSTISNSYATGSVSAKGSFVGGLVGQNTSNNGTSTISNSYATGSVSGSENVGGLVGYNNSFFNGTPKIENSFYDKTKFSGNGVGNEATNSGATGLTTAQMSYGQIFKNASWDIVADSSVTSTTPVLKYDSVNHKYVWAIAPLALNYTLSDKTTTYDGTTQSLSNLYTTSSIFDDDYGITSSDFNFQISGSNVTGYKNAGTYSNIKVTSNSDFLTINATGNTDGNLTINKKAITVVADDKTKVYGDSNPTLTYSLATGYSLVGSDSLSSLVSGNLSTNATSTSGVGSYTINGLSAVANDNYTVTFSDGKLTITPKELTVYYGGIDKEYDGTTKALVRKGISGIINSDDISISESVNFVDKNAGQNKTINISNILINGEDASNYKISLNNQTTTTATITPKAIIVVADNKTKVYGDSNPSLTYVATGLIGTDTLSGDLNTNVTVDSIVGNYDINQGNLLNSNYEILFTKGVLSVLAKNETPTPTPTPNPTPNEKSEKELEKVINSIDRIVNANLPKNQEFITNPNNQITSSTQITPDISNPNVRVLSFNSGKNINVIGDGIKMPINQTIELTNLIDKRIER